MEPIKQNCNVPRGQQKDNISFWSRKKYFSSPMNAERLDVILPIVGSNINEQIWVKVKVSRNVPRGQVFLLSTETLEGDKIGCIYSVMIKMATTTNVQETTEDRRRQKYRKNNPKLVQLSNLKFSAKERHQTSPKTPAQENWTIAWCDENSWACLWNRWKDPEEKSSWWKFVQAGSHQARKISSKTRPQWSHPRAWWFGWFGWIK